MSGRRTGSPYLEVCIPELEGWDYEVTSDFDFGYNCIAYTAGDEERIWWPLDDESVYWPVGAPFECTVNAFVRAYELIGYGRCEDDSFDAGYDKIALYLGEDGNPRHAALQVDGLYWKSKLGRLHDIKHPLRALEGSTYGHPTVFLRRPRLADRRARPFERLTGW